MGKQAPTRQKRTQKDYTLGFKLSVVAQVEKGEMTYKQAQKHLWNTRTKYRFSLVEKAWYNDWRNPQENQTPMQKIETPAQKIKRLEKQLSDEKAKNLILNTLVDHRKTIWSNPAKKATYGILWQLKETKQLSLITGETKT